MIVVQILVAVIFSLVFSAISDTFASGCIATGLAIVINLGIGSSVSSKACETGMAGERTTPSGGST